MILFPQNLDKRACERKFCQYSVGLFQKFLIISPFSTFLSSKLNLAQFSYRIHIVNLDILRRDRVGKNSLTKWDCNFLHLNQL